MTLHVGLGTFRPVKEDEIEQHDMHSEYCTIPQETADLINAHEGERRAGDLRRHDLLPHHRELGGGGRYHDRDRRLDEHLTSIRATASR